MFPSQNWTNHPGYQLWGWFNWKHENHNKRAPTDDSCTSDLLSLIITDISDQVQSYCISFSNKWCEISQEISRRNNGFIIYLVLRLYGITLHQPQSTELWCNPCFHGGGGGKRNLLSCCPPHTPLQLVSCHTKIWIEEEQQQIKIKQKSSI